jgi:hypothetical protein
LSSGQYFESSNKRDPSSCSGKSSVEAQMTAKHTPQGSGHLEVHRKLASETGRAKPEKENLAKTLYMYTPPDSLACWLQLLLVVTTMHALVTNMHVSLSSAT